MSNEPSKLDYARPESFTAPPRGELRAEQVGDGVRFIGPSREYQKVGKALGVGAAAALLFAIWGAAEGLKSGRFEWASVGLALFASIPLAVGAVSHLRARPKPVVLEIHPASVHLQSNWLPWTTRRTWKTRQVRRIKIRRINNPANPARMLCNLYLVTTFSTLPVFEGFELAELQKVCDMATSIAGLKIDLREKRWWQNS